MKSLGNHKRGDTLEFTVGIIDKATNEALTGASASLKCQGRYNYGDDVLVDMDVSETSTAGTYLFSASAETTRTWTPNRTIIFDIEYTNADGKVSSTETLTVFIEEDVTRDG